MLLGHRSLLPAALAAATLLLGACTSSGSAADEVDGVDSTSEVADTTSTTAAPTVLALAEELGLLPQQCYDDVPELPTTTTTAPSTTIAPSDGEETTTTVATTTEPTAPTTTIAKPPTVAVVDCDGTSKGVVYAALCIGSLVEVGEPIDQPTELGQVGCPGDGALEWPGDRLLRRSAARVCLQLFEQVYGESYAESDINTSEFVPSRGVWDRADRRVVCAADQAAP